MSDAVLAIVLFSVILIGVATTQVMRWLSRRRWHQHEELEFLVDEGFDRISDRWLIDSRIIRYQGRRHGMQMEVESGCGPTRTYARAEVHFPREVPLGVRISSEHEEGVLTRVLRLREIEIGLNHFDSQFILLSRDEDRLKSLLGVDLRQLLLRLRQSVRDVRLDEEGVHFNVTGQRSPEEFMELVDHAARLASTAHQRAIEILEEEQRATESSVFTPIPGTLEAVKGPEENTT